MSELLAISWEMPPLSGPRAVQVTRTLLALVPNGWRSRVVCFGPRSDRYNQDFHVSPEQESDGAVQRLPVPSLEEMFFFRALWRIAPPLKRMPDEKRVWIGAALAAARTAISQRRPDVIVSFAQPWSDHLIGLALHRETGLPWVAHFSDPWIDSPYATGPGWQRRAAARMERDVVSEASRVVFVNAHTADAVMKKYPGEWRRRAAVVPQGYDPAVVPGAVPGSEGPLRIVYTGRFYDGRRTPDGIFGAVVQLRGSRRLGNGVAIEIVGGAMEPYERRASAMGLADVVTFHGRRSPADAAAVAARADVLLVVDAPSRGPNLFQPSKLIDYLPLKKPILGVTPAEGATADLLERLGYPIVDPCDRDAIARAIADLIAAKAEGRLAPSPQHDAVAAQYDIRETTRAMARVLDEARAA